MGATERFLTALAVGVVAVLALVISVAMFVLLLTAALWPLWVALAALKYLWTGTLL